MMMNLSAKNPALAGEDVWNPVYLATQKENLPICMHSALPLPLPSPANRFRNILPITALYMPWNLILHLTSILYDGVPERFPKLNFVLIEGGVTWIPWVMHHLDDYYQRRRFDAPLLTKPPSEYIKSCVYFASQPLEHPYNIRDLEWVFNQFGAEKHLMYASDYPHPDFDAPSSIYDLPFLSKDAKRRILGDNARELFRIN